MDCSYSGITKEDVLNRTHNGLHFYAHVMSQKGVTLKLDNNTGLKNPFYDDKNGSLSIYRNGQQYLFNDFGHPQYKGDVFRFASFHYGLDCQTNFSEILQNICRDLHLNLKPSKEKRDSLDWWPEEKKEEPKEQGNINIVEGGEFLYWLDFGDRQGIKTTLEDYGVRSLTSYTAINKQDKPFTIQATPASPIYAFRISDNYFKLYRPNESKSQYKHVWLGTKPDAYQNIFGLPQLPDHSEYILIVEGLKDCIIAVANGFMAIALDNAGTRLGQQTVSLLQSKCDHLLLCLDNDQAGLDASERLSKEHRLQRIILPQTIEGKAYGKDISDYFYAGFSSQYLKGLISETIKETLPEPQPIEEPQTDNFKKIIQSKTFLQENITNKVTFASPILKRGDQGIFYHNTINVIQGKTGAHKSRLVENLCSCLLSNDPSKQFLGFGKRLLDFNAYSVLYVDTERNLKDQYLYALQQIKYNAGYTLDNELPNFDFISLIDIPRDERFAALKEYLEYVRQKFNNHIFIVLDVITDCISNFNDPKESLKLIDLLNVMINRFNVSFLCIIHENPTDNSNKARGHLGTEIMNKASCQMQIGFEKDKGNNDTDLIKVKYLKTRIGKRPEPFYLQYSEEHRGLVIADPDFISDVVNCKKHKANLSDLMQYLGGVLTEPMERQELFNSLMIEFDCGVRTIEGRIKSITDNSEMILNQEAVECRLIKEYQNRKSYYSLIPASNELLEQKSE